MYSPSLGRFLQVDPVSGGSANAYDYVDQDPVNELDLDGDSKDPCDLVAGIGQEDGYVYIDASFSCAKKVSGYIHTCLYTVIGAEELTFGCNRDPETGRRTSYFFYASDTAEAKCKRGSKWLGKWDWAATYEGLEYGDVGREPHTGYYVCK